MCKKEKKKEKNYLLSLVKKHKQYSGYIYTTITGQVISSLVAGSFGILFKYLIDAMNDGNESLFINTVIILAILFSLNIPLLGLRTYSIGRYTSSIMADMRNELANKATTMKTSELDNMHSGDFVSKANNDLGQIRTYFSTHLQFSIRLIVGGVVSFGLMLYLGWLLTLITFLATPVFLFLTILIGKPLKNLVVKRNEKLAEVNKYTQDALGGYVEIRTYQLHTRLGGKIKQAIDDSVKLLFKTAAIESFSRGFGFLSRIIPVIILMAVGSIFIVKGIGGITIGTIIAISSLSNAPLNLLFHLSNIVNNYKKAQGSTKGLLKIFEYEDERTSGSVLNINETHPIISFKDVSFSYQSESSSSPVLNNISFDIYKGEQIAFVGESGCGKSTIIKLIAGFYAVDSGSILISNENINNLNLKDYRKNISIVDQDTYLYPGTLYENISCGVINEYEEVPEELVKQAAISANIHEFILSLPNQYETFAMERGVRLSGGQKQRITMARACIREAEILLLDEPTSALDMENEMIVQEQLQKLMVDKTSIIVAHRLSTIKDVNQIFVIDKGNIVEKGTHNDLIALKGKYYDLSHKQLEKEREAINE